MNCKIAGIKTIVETSLEIVPTENVTSEDHRLYLAYSRAVSFLEYTVCLSMSIIILIIIFLKVVQNMMHEY